MDYDYYDESRTRFQLQSGPSSAQSQEEKWAMDFLQVGACCSVALLCSAIALYHLQGFPQFLLLWVASALFVGPFAPLSATGGSCRVGAGELLPPEEEEEEEAPVEAETFSDRNPRHRRRDLSVAAQEPSSLKGNGTVGKHAVHHVGENGMLEGAQGGICKKGDGNDGSSGADDEVFDYDNDSYYEKAVCDASVGRVNQDGDAEWTAADIELLKKLMVRYPRGMLKRWQVIAESFDGSHGVESIVKMSKAIGEKKKSDNESYSEFLAKRKGQTHEITSPLSQRWDLENSKMQDVKSAEADEKIINCEHNISQVADESRQGQGKKKSEWTESEDKSLLSALKTFPKDTPMRWEKVGLAVPTRTKQQCFQRYTQLKEGFRNKLEKS